MGAVPKHKVSKARRDKRRTHDALHPFQLVACSDCGEMKRAHRVCPSCGKYNGRQIITVEAE